MRDKIIGTTITGNATNAIYLRNKSTSATVSVENIDSSSKVYFDGKIRYSGGEPSITWPSE